jgi:TatD DNase family protein
LVGTIGKRKKSMPIFDTHCHYNLEPLFSEVNGWQFHWQNAQSRGVTHSVVVGTSPETSQIALDISAQEKNLYASVGIHPTEWHWQDTQETINSQVSDIEVLASQTKVVAIGEIGLDYYRLDKEDPTFVKYRENQLASLQQQLGIAIKHSLPVILHVRDIDIPEEPVTHNAYWDIITVLKEMWPAGQPFILHCVSGPLNYVKQALELGAYVGVAGNVTYPSADHIRHIVTTAPVEKLLLETDAPYLAPVPHRGKVCEPHMIADTETFLRTEMNVDVETIYQNALGLFGQHSTE